MELDRDAKRILDLTRAARTPRRDDKERIGRRLAASLVLGATSAHAGTSIASKAVGATWAAKWAAIAIVATAGGVGYLGVRARPTADTVAMASVAPPPAPAAAERPMVKPPVADMPAAPSGDSDRTRDEEPRHAMTAKSSAPRVTLSEELDLLHEAQAKWRSGNAPAALAVIGEHRTRFPRSALAPERDALAVLSLCATNRVAEAKRLARHFLATAPRSPLKRAVEESCAGELKFLAPG
jgi:hypothetical protein